MLKGFAKCYKNLVVAAEENPRVLKYIKAPIQGKVGVVTGGGSGHKPAFIGYIGKNMCDAVAVGDLNGDGLPDYVVADYNLNQVEVYLSQAPAKAGGAVTYAGPFLYTTANATGSTGLNPVSVTLADLTGNGVLSIVTANNRDGTMRVLANNGKGVFGPPTIINVGQGPTQVIAGLFDKVGKKAQDLVVAHNGTSSSGNSRGVSVLINSNGLTATLAAATDDASLVERVGALEPEGPAGRSRQGGQVGAAAKSLSQVARERPDIRAGGTTHLDGCHRARGIGAVPAGDLEPMDRDSPRSQLWLFAVPRQLVRRVRTQAQQTEDRIRRGAERASHACHYSMLEYHAYTPTWSIRSTGDAARWLRSWFWMCREPRKHSTIG